MIVYMFMDRFAANVEMGDKPCTIRPESGKVPIIGQPVSLRKWSGLPYRSPQIELRQAYISNVRPIHIDRQGNIKINRKRVTFAYANSLAEMDGFESVHDLVTWFHDTHGLPFKGIFIEWDHVPRLHVGCDAHHHATRMESKHPDFPGQIIPMLDLRPVRVLAIAGRWAMIRRMDFRGATPYVADVGEVAADNYWRVTPSTTA